MEMYIRYCQHTEEMVNLVHETGFQEVQAFELNLAE